jgi:sarcosine oxidase gamma subunit
MGVEACRNRLCTWVRRHPSIVSLATTDESALANTVLQNFTALIDAPDAEAIAMASQREATLVTSERSTKMPEAAGRYDVQWITPDQFLREWPGRRRGR